jgi:hypothetical protein
MGAERSEAGCGQHFRDFGKNQVETRAGSLSQLTVFKPGVLLFILQTGSMARRLRQLAFASSRASATIMGLLQS